MANWIPVSYALTGSKEELLDIESKIMQAEQVARETEEEAKAIRPTICDVELFARLIGSELTYADLGGYWYADGESLEWKQTDDGEEYLLWLFKNKHWENPAMREMIEGAYKTVKIFYEAPSSDTNDTEERYFVPRIKLTNIEGLNYVLRNDGTALLHCDDSFKGKVLRAPEQIACGGKEYRVNSFGDAFEDPQYGSSTLPPKELEEIFFPATIEYVGNVGYGLVTLKAIHFAGDIDEICEYAFAGCEQLATVEFAGKVNTIGFNAFSNTAIKDIQIPDGTRVDPCAFEGSPFGNKKSLALSLSTAQELPGGVAFLRQMQYRMDIHILITDPYDTSYMPVEFDKSMSELTEQFRWIYDNLGDELLRNTIVGKIETLRLHEDRADVSLSCYTREDSYMIEITVKVEGQDDMTVKFENIEELGPFLLNLDAHIEEYKEDKKNGYFLPYWQRNPKI